MINNAFMVCVWGTGSIGKRCADYLDNIAAFIDSNKDKQGTIFENKKVISLEDYLIHYKEYLIIIAVLDENAIAEIEKKLIDASVFNYVLWPEVPDEIYYPLVAFPFKKVLNSKNINRQDTIIICGKSYFSFMVYDYCERNGYYNISLKVESAELLAWLKRKKIRAQIGFSEEKEVKNIYTTKTEWDNSKKSINDIPFYEFAWLHQKINSKLIVFKDVHLGDRCFIVATGPSVQISDLELLHRNKEWSFSVNRVYKVFDETNWRPSYYVATDQEMLKTYSDDVISLDVSVKFLNDSYKPFWDMVEEKRTPSIYKIHETVAYFGKGKPDFSSDIAKAIYGGSTSIYTCLQIAIYMGFKKIYLIGADCEIKGNGHDDCDHFVKGYSDGAQKAYGLKSFYRVFKAYEATKEYADANGIHIYNATRGGKLEIFPRVDFDSLFE